jgi:hypothetical protein
VEHSNKRTLFSFCLLLVVVLAVPLFADQVLDGWNISTGDNGAVVSMSISNPRTYLNIEDIVKIQLNNQGIPVSGRVRFKSGDGERDLIKGEVMFFWENFKGQHALWKYLGSQGRLNSFNPQTEPIPDSYFGKMTRVVVKTTSIELFGILARSQDGQNAFMLQIEGASNGPIHCEKNAVALMQQMK